MLVGQKNRISGPYFKDHEHLPLIVIEPFSIVQSIPPHSSGQVQVRGMPAQLPLQFSASAGEAIPNSVAAPARTPTIQLQDNAVQGATKPLFVEKKGLQHKNSPITSFLDLKTPHTPPL